MVAGNSALTDPSWLVPLLYRVDWTQLCLSAEITTRTERIRSVTISPGRDFWRPVTEDGPDYHDEDDEDGDPRETWRLASEADAAENAGPAGEDGEDGDDGSQPRSRDARLLIAPGGRYRSEDISPDPRWSGMVCDGETCWRVSAGEVHRDNRQGLHSDFAALLDPSWLVGLYDLDLTGAAEAAGRPACRVVATPRPVGFGSSPHPYRQLDRVDVLVDAELGILLRREAFADGKQVELAEVRSLILDPAEAGDPAQFRPPPELPVAEDRSAPESCFDMSGPGWSMVKTGGRAAGAALTFAVRHTGGQSPAPAAAAPPVPEPGPPPAAGAAAPLSADLVNLLHRTELSPQRFAAGVRKWTDGELVVRAIAAHRAILPRPLSGILGPDALWDAITDRASQSCRTMFQTARLRLAMPGRYRIDYLAGDWKERASACDGTRCWTAYPNRVVREPARPLGDDWARLADPAWLLLVSGWQLTAAGAEDVGGRRGWRIWADARPGRRGITGADMFMQPAAVFSRAAVTVDAELGIVLRLAFLVDDKPAICFELHDVSVPAADDPADFRVQVPPGARLVEGTGPLSHLDVPAPLQAVWTVGKAGLASASAVAGWLQKLAGKPGEGDKHQT
jgi:hypothetical protein